MQSTKLALLELKGDFETEDVSFHLSEAGNAKLNRKTDKPLWERDKMSVSSHSGII